MRLRNIAGSEELIAGSIYVCSQPEIYRGKWNSFFQNENPIHIEIGMGKGKFITEMARMHPDINYIGIDKYSSVLCRAVQKLDHDKLMKPDTVSDREGFNNLTLICMDASDVTKVFGQGEIDRIYLNFSDPWPKERHAERRLTSHKFLTLFETILCEEGILEFKTDNEVLFRFGLAELEPVGWKIDKVTYDLHHNQEMMIANVMTEYEEKFSSLGNPIYKFIASHCCRRKNNPLPEKDLFDGIRSKRMELMIKEDNFQKEVLESNIPVLVDFYADWCGPCKMMGPVISGLAKEYSGRCKITKCNIDNEMALASRYRVLSIPTIIIFKNGRPEKTIVGAVSKKELVEKLEQALG